MNTEPLTIYCESRTLEDAQEYIEFKNETDGWEVLVPPHLIPISIPCGTGRIVSLSGYSFILHRFNQFCI